MSANATTAMHGQSSNVGPLGAAAVLTAVVAFGALGFVIGQGVATTTTTAARPAAGPVIDNTSMTGPRIRRAEGPRRCDRRLRGSSTPARSPTPVRRGSVRVRPGSRPARCRDLRHEGRWCVDRASDQHAVQRHGLRGSVRDVAQGPVHGRQLGLPGPVPALDGQPGQQPVQRLRLRGSVRELAQGPGRDRQRVVPGLLPAPRPGCRQPGLPGLLPAPHGSRRGRHWWTRRSASRSDRPVPLAPDRNQPDTAPVPGAVSCHVRRMRQSGHGLTTTGSTT